MSLTPEDKTQIMHLYFRILENKALLAEYYEYENILLKYGYSPEQISKKFNNAEFKNVAQFYNARNLKEFKSKIIDWEPIVVGGFLGLGLRLVLAESSNKQKRLSND